MIETTPRCQSNNQAGEPCSAKVWRDGWCHWHHPGNRERHIAASRAGGRARSNEARARKRLKGTDRDFATVLGKLLNGIDKVETGEIEPGVLNAMANAARAVQSLAGPVSIQEEIETLRREVDAIKQDRGIA